MVRWSSLEDLDYGWILNSQGWKPAKVLRRRLSLTRSLPMLPLTLRAPSAWQLGTLCALTYDPLSAEYKAHPGCLATSHWLQTPHTSCRTERLSSKHPSQPFIETCLCVHWNMSSLYPDLLCVPDSDSTGMPGLWLHCSLHREAPGCLSRGILPPGAASSVSLLFQKLFLIKIYY